MIRSLVRTMRQPLWGAAVMLGLGCAFLAVVRELFILHVLTFVFIFTIYAQSWNLVAHSGQFSLGHAVFLGLGAYGSTLLSTRLGVPPALSLFLGPLLAAVVGLGIGALCRHLREVYLGMVTFGCSAIVQVLVVEQFAWLTNRWDGLTAPRLVPEGITIARTADVNYLVGLVLMVGTYLVVAAIMRSRTGLAFVALHDNELVASTAGINVVRYRLLAMMLGGYLAGLSGALNGHTLTRHIEPGIFGLADSIWPMLYTIAGGLGTAEGPIIGTLVVRVLWEWVIRRLGGFESLILIGVLLAVVVIALPRGIYPMVARAAAWATGGLAAKRAHLPQRQP
ncbi:MAG: branched-chain amino acid ABC transporter permease [bacterium]